MNTIALTKNVLRARKDFSKIPSILEIPDLIEIQKRTFDRFLQLNVEQEKRENVGLQAVFNSVFPIKDFNDSASLEFVGYTLEEPKYDVQECLQRGMTYAAPFKVTIRLVAWDDTEGSQAIRDVKEQEVYFGEVPIMTENGTFIINGTERVIVSQLHRSPGIFYDTSISTTVSAAGKKIYSCRIIPYRGSWLDLEFDHKDLIYARIDRRRKIFGTVLLKALGYTPEEMLAYFYKSESVRIDGKKIIKSVVAEVLIGQRCTKEVKDARGKVLVRKDRKFTDASVRKIVEAGIAEIQVTLDDLIRTDAVTRVAHNEGVTPAKMFEYLSIGTPVLGLAPPDGDLARILRETSGGCTFAHEDADGITAFIAEHAARAARGDPPPRPDPTALHAYDRRIITGKLAALFDRLVNSHQSIVIGEG